MPEGPDIKYIADKIFAAYFIGNYIKFRNIHKKGVDEIAEHKLLVRNVYNKGKNIFIKVLVDDREEKFIHIHLMLFGWYSLINNDPGKLKFTMDAVDQHGKVVKSVYYTDAGNWGVVKLIAIKETEEIIKKLGPDIFSDSFTLEEFKEKLKADNRYLFDTLIDQSIISGMGNYMRAETIYLAGIKYDKDAKDLTDEEIKKLYHAIKHIAKKVYDADVAGEEYNYLIYGRTKTDKNETVSQIRHKNRTVYVIKN